MANTIEIGDAPDGEILDAIDASIDDLKLSKTNDIWPLAIIAKQGVAHCPQKHAHGARMIPTRLFDQPSISSGILAPHQKH